MKTKLEAADTMLAASTLKTQVKDNSNINGGILYFTDDYPQDLSAGLREKRKMKTIGSVLLI